MIRKITLFFLACASLFGGARAQSIQIDRVTIGESAPLSMERRFVRLGTEEPFTITFYKISQRQRAALVIPNTGSDQTGASLSFIFKVERPIAAMNGGFLRTLLPATPAGYVQANLKVVNSEAITKLDPVFSGFVCFDKSKPTIIAPTELLRQTRLEYQDCLEGGPLILFDGQPAADLDRFDEMYPQYRGFVARRAERSFVALTARGETILGVTEPTSLRGLRAVLMANEKSGGLAAASAITLTGRSTAGLMVRGKDEIITAGSTSAFLPNAIVVRD